MPTNLPPQYFEIEKKLKTATTTEDKISIQEELLSIIPKHKGTEKLQALLKTKIAKLKSISQRIPITAKHGSTHTIRKSGAGQIVLVGPPNAGKSLLVKSLTNADPLVSDYPFTTNLAYPAMMKFKNIQIQLIDTPPITPDYIEIWHPELIKAADGVLLLVDLSNTNPAETFRSILDKLKKKRIEFIGTDQVPTESTFFYKKALIVANKNDLAKAEKDLNGLRDSLGINLELILISASTGQGLEDLKEKIYSLLGIIRVYSKAPGKKTELKDPFILRKGSTVMDMARAVHKDFTQKLNFARIWSKNKYQGQKVNRNYVLDDEDIIELHK